nr:uncharacterized protein LOC129493261 [Symphalangus syndactylus]XP_055155187.1 uncharacterized protein LOC129493261 [Symphalangus syndactylus]XP_055155188.1 uncharacterized protein LOC129493261 [Symphalangus syndactylus]XP_055155189.1 uncharacterized protein LOC129493261 [Symphalangus syndactylus]XP_055155191.1 uncharacterized protein LOC129493261 [Symphalangus syndactylus]
MLPRQLPPQRPSRGFRGSRPLAFFFPPFGELAVLGLSPKSREMLQASVPLPTRRVVPEAGLEPQARRDSCGRCWGLSGRGRSRFRSRGRGASGLLCLLSGQ